MDPATLSFLTALLSVAGTILAQRYGLHLPAPAPSSSSSPADAPKAPAAAPAIRPIGQGGLLDLLTAAVALATQHQASGQPAGPQIAGGVNAIRSVLDQISPPAPQSAAPAAAKS